jgi:hypothetical protein
MTGPGRVHAEPMLIGPGKRQKAVPLDTGQDRARALRIMRVGTSTRVIRPVNVADPRVESVNRHT